MADAWRPTSELERRLHESVRAGDQEGYFRVLADSELVLPVPPDVVDDVLANTAQPTWPTQEEDGRVHVLTYTSAAAMRACLGPSYRHFMTLRFEDIAQSWPDAAWWLAVDVPGPGVDAALPIEARLPSWFVRQVAEGDGRPPRVGRPGAPAEGPWEELRGQHRDLPREARRPEFQPANDVERELLRAAANNDHDLFLQTLAGTEVLLPVPEDTDYSLRPGRPGFPWQTRDVDGATVVPVFTSPERLIEAARAAGTGTEYIRLPFTVALRYWPHPDWQLAINSGSPAGGTVQAQQLPGLATWADQRAAQRMTDGFEPQNEIEQRLFDAARRRDTDAFYKILLGAQVLVPADPDTPWGVAPDDPAFPWQPVDVHGRTSIQVFTSLKWMNDALSSSRFVMPTLHEMVAAWPDTAWTFVLNPGTPIDASMPGDQVRALAGRTVPEEPATPPSAATPPPPDAPAVPVAPPVPAGPEPSGGDPSQTAVDALESLGTRVAPGPDGPGTAWPQHDAAGTGPSVREPAPPTGDPIGWPQHEPSAHAGAPGPQADVPLDGTGTSEHPPPYGTTDRPSAPEGLGDPAQPPTGPEHAQALPAYPTGTDPTAPPGELGHHAQTGADQPAAAHGLGDPAQTPIGPESAQGLPARPDPAAVPHAPGHAAPTATGTDQPPPLEGFGQSAQGTDGNGPAPAASGADRPAGPNEPAQTSIGDEHARPQGVLAHPTGPTAAPDAFGAAPTATGTEPATAAPSDNDHARTDGLPGQPAQTSGGPQPAPAATGPGGDPAQVPGLPGQPVGTDHPATPGELGHHAQAVGGAEPVQATGDQHARTPGLLGYPTSVDQPPTPDRPGEPAPSIGGTDHAPTATGGDPAQPHALTGHPGQSTSGPQHGPIATGDAEHAGTHGLPGQAATDQPAQTVGGAEPAQAADDQHARTPGLLGYPTSIDQPPAPGGPQHGPAGPGAGDDPADGLPGHPSSTEQAPTSDGLGNPAQATGTTGHGQAGTGVGGDPAQPHGQPAQATGGPQHGPIATGDAEQSRTHGLPGQPTVGGAELAQAAGTTGHGQAGTGVGGDPAQPPGQPTQATGGEHIPPQGAPGRTGGAEQTSAPDGLGEPGQTTDGIEPATAANGDIGNGVPGQPAHTEQAPTPDGLGQHAQATGDTGHSPAAGISGDPAQPHGNTAQPAQATSGGEHVPPQGAPGQPGGAEQTSAPDGLGEPGQTTDGIGHAPAAGVGGNPAQPHGLTGQPAQATSGGEHVPPHGLPGQPGGTEQAPTSGALGDPAQATDGTGHAPAAGGDPAQPHGLTGQPAQATGGEHIPPQGAPGQPRGVEQPSAPDGLGDDAQSADGTGHSPAAGSEGDSAPPHGVTVEPAQATGGTGHAPAAGVGGDTARPHDLTGQPAQATGGEHVPPQGAPGQPGGAEQTAAPDVLGQPAQTTDGIEPSAAAAGGIESGPAATGGAGQAPTSGGLGDPAQATGGTGHAPAAGDEGDTARPHGLTGQPAQATGGEHAPPQGAPGQPGGAEQTSAPNGLGQPAQTTDGIEPATTATGDTGNDPAVIGGTEHAPPHGLPGQPGGAGQAPTSGGLGDPAQATGGTGHAPAAGGEGDTARPHDLTGQPAQATGGEHAPPQGAPGQPGGAEQTSAPDGLGQPAQTTDGIEPSAAAAGGIESGPAATGGAGQAPTSGGLGDPARATGGTGDGPAATGGERVPPRGLPGRTGAERPPASDGGESAQASGGYEHAQPVQSAGPAAVSDVPGQGASGGYGLPGRTGGSDGGRGLRAVPDAEAGFEPGNRIDQELYDATLAGDSDAFLRVLLNANVLVPIPEDAPLEVTPIQRDFRWDAALRDDAAVRVFTSLVRLREILPEARFVYADFRELIGAWPREDWAMLLNPGTRIGASLRGEQVRALSEWAIRVGLIQARPAAPPSREPRPEPEARPVPQPAADPDDRVSQLAIMQKVVPHGHVAWYLEQGYDRVGGFVHLTSDVAELQTPAQLYEALGLLYDDSPFAPGDEGVYVIRWPAYCPDVYRVPFGGATEAEMAAWGEAGWVVERAPFVGTGFAPGSAGSIREFKVDSIRLPYGSEMYYLAPDRSERFVAMYDPDRLGWLRPEPGAEGGDGRTEAAQ